MNLEIKGWEKVEDYRKQGFFDELERLLDKYELFGVFEEKILEELRRY